ncbi:alpha/beta fold hydrolase [Alterisphingorhabdus coralli]|uniref:Proline iminopeptidase n=1 Tax=Alterisphingorhabdus coralli TaxID=3071408 RepID=A0AA97F916_9SPHN|nr:alpha/beta fold hydrolase [Parasphingorhabdus sp. SCSIO 66989]WOE75502.1 alpha/beta fold hydrolase [Parasphingorhabdus sp. SCSIO 66989]
MRRLDDPYFDILPETQSGMLDVGDGHEIYWEEAGNPDGIPVILIHGGPGGRTQPGFRRSLDSNIWRVIQFDQRGCGRSTPEGLIEANSLQHTIADMEALREHLEIDRWVVAGGSWGSTVTLAYGIAHPGNCLALTLISMWLCRDEDIHWWFQGVRYLFPELWHEFARHVPEAERSDLRTAYCARILDGEQEIADEFATRLYQYEEGFMRFAAPVVPLDLSRGPKYGRIFAHYARNKFFVAGDELLDGASAIAHLPVKIITGRYDCCTTPSNAFDLSQRLPEADITLVAGAGHYPTEERMSLVCLEKTSELADELQASGWRA